MRPGFRRDTLDSHFSFYNWRKIINRDLGSTLLGKMGDASSDMADYVQQHQVLERSLSSDVLVNLTWRIEIEAWKAEVPSPPNLFEQVIITPTQVTVCRGPSEKVAISSTGRQ
ncbi:hypothetical protein F5887DRAFT_1101424 [Amanita rubescens]|nr:hypothetical protein F5887DRAFT_1101424 [Amanita rubescens]